MINVCDDLDDDAQFTLRRPHHSTIANTKFSYNFTLSRPYECLAQCTQASTSILALTVLEMYIVIRAALINAEFLSL